MRVLVQWTRRNPRDWEEIDSANWQGQPMRPIPARGELGGRDNAPGWVFVLNIQGVVFGGYDHYHVEDIPGGCRVTAWDDDPDDEPPRPWAGCRWTFLEPAPDPRYGGQINTRQSVEYWHDAAVPGAASGGPHITHPRGAFAPPAGGRHGIWVPETKLDEHNRVRSHRGWQEWIA